MKKLILLSLCVVACGPNFNGTYTGTVTETEYCGPGAMDSIMTPLTVTISDTGGVIVAMPSPCSVGDTKATSSGDTITLGAEADCDLSINLDAGTVVTTSINSGRLALIGDTLNVNLQTHVQTTGADGGCDDSYTGDLAAQ